MENKKADAANIGFPSNLNPMRRVKIHPDYKPSLDLLQSKILESVAQVPKVVKLYPCFACDRNVSVRRMSRCLIVCKECWKTVPGKGPVAKRNFVDRTLNNIHRFLRRRVEC